MRVQRGESFDYQAYILGRVEELVQQENALKHRLEKISRSKLSVENLAKLAQEQHSEEKKNYENLRNQLENLRQKKFDVKQVISI